MSRVTPIRELVLQVVMQILEEGDTRNAVLELVPEDVVALLSTGVKILEAQYLRLMRQLARS